MACKVKQVTRLISSLDANRNQVDLTSCRTLHFQVNKWRCPLPHRSSNLQLNWVMHNVLFRHTLSSWLSDDKQWWVIRNHLQWDTQSFQHFTVIDWLVQWILCVCVCLFWSPRLSVCRLSVLRQISETTRDTCEILSPLEEIGVGEQE